jgi:hypothetical protein
LLATTRPAVSDFLQHVLFNCREGIETTELYMQDDSPNWVTLELKLRRTFNAVWLGTIGKWTVYLYSTRIVYDWPKRGTDYYHTHGSF